MAGAAKELWALPVAALARRLAAGTVTATELAEAYLARIGEVDGHIHSFIHVATERARKAAAP